MIQKFPRIEGQFNPGARPITILSVGHPERWQRTIERVIPPLLADPVAGQAVAYWLLDVPQEEDGTYNGGRAYNDALWECESPMVVFSSGDSMIMPQLLWRAYGVYRETGRPILSLRADETEENSGAVQENNHAIGDLMLMPREWAIEAGGWDERMISWGFSDYALSIRLEMIGHCPIILGERWQDRTIHLWHSRREDAWYNDQNKLNQKLFLESPAWTKTDFLVGRMAKECR